MPGQRPEPGRGPEEKPPSVPHAEPAGAPAAAEAAPKSENAASWQAWLPLVVAIVAMPLLAFAVTDFVLVPHLQKALRGGGAVAPAATEAEGSSSKEGAPSASQQQSVPLNKLLVNVAGTLGSRYLLTSVTIMGSGSEFKRRITDKEPQLRDVATSILAAKTIADIEKPGARNVIRGELLAAINAVLGDPGAQEIYFTEFAIQ
jgi:flagellar FliL protein